MADTIYPKYNSIHLDFNFSALQLKVMSNKKAVFCKANLIYNFIFLIYYSKWLQLHDYIID